MLRKIFLAIGLVTLLVPAQTAAINVFESCSGGPYSDAEVCKASRDEKDEGKKLMQNIINTLMFILGALCTIMIVIGGIRYASSNGDSGQITAAKNTILYAVVGLIVAILASLVVNFILNQF